MGCRIVWKQNLQRHWGSLAGLFALVFLVSLSLSAVLAVWHNSSRYLRDEMTRMGYGSITAWVSGVPDVRALVGEMKAVEGVAAMGVQEVIYADYEARGQESDSEGQLVTYTPEEYPYKLFTDDLAGYRQQAAWIAPGEVYVSPSLRSMFAVELGDTITFSVARSGVDRSFVVKGYFEDPFMGSAMIGMKSFLISEQDHDEIEAMILEAGNNGLARSGYMLHILPDSGSAETAAALNARLNGSTGLQRHLEFTHSREAIEGFMLTLQNVFTGFLLAFVAVLLLVSLVVLSHSIAGAIEQDTTNMGILKTLGMKSGALRQIQLLQYLTGILPGVVLGVLAAVPAAAFVCRMTLTATGLMIPAILPWRLCTGALGMILLLLLGFIWVKTGRIGRILPMAAIQDKNGRQPRRAAYTPLRQKGLGFWLAVRQLAMGKRRYASACTAAMLLVFFASLLGRVNAWLGPAGEGLMNAFNPAELHIAAQPMGNTDIADIERTISEYTAITDSYMLGMPSVSVNDVDYTVNVITDPQRFHLLQGRACTGPDEIVLTEFVAADLGVGVGDTVTVAASHGRGEYVITGIYQCANDLGANVGMNQTGYDQIGEESSTMWCTHYFLADPDQQPQIMQALKEAYGGDVYLHENSWPGLGGILSAMQLLMVFLYAIVTLFVLVVTLLTAGKLLTAEQRDLGVYKAIGCSSGRLRRSFALRFGITALVGSVLGTLFSAVLIDPLAGALLRMQGISNFSSQPNMGTVLMPGAAVVLLFFLFAWLAAGRIRRVQPSMLILK